MKKNNDCIENKFKELSEVASKEICELLGKTPALALAVAEDGEVIILYSHKTYPPILDFKICAEKTKVRKDEKTIPFRLEINIPKPKYESDTCDDVTVCGQQLMYAKWPPRQGSGGG